MQLRAAIDRGGGSPGPTDAPAIDEGLPVPPIAGATLDGIPFSLDDLRGRPVIVNFWGPSCIPCRSEFPLFKSMLEVHADEGLAIVGVLMDDPPAPARDFIALYGATWPTVDDPEQRLRRAYRVVARPMSFFVDRDGILRSIQVGELTQAEFDRQLAAIAAPAGASAEPGSPAAPAAPSAAP